MDGCSVQQWRLNLTLQLRIARCPCVVIGDTIALRHGGGVHIGARDEMQHQRRYLRVCTRSVGSLRVLLCQVRRAFPSRVVRRYAAHTALPGCVCVADLLMMGVMICSLSTKQQ